MADVWDDLGDTHVIIALTPDECKALLSVDDGPGQIAAGHRPHFASARRQVRLGLRDQKDIDA